MSVLLGIIDGSGGDVPPVLLLYVEVVQGVVIHVGGKAQNFGIGTIILNLVVINTITILHKNRGSKIIIIVCSSGFRNR